MTAKMWIAEDDTYWDYEIHVTFGDQTHLGNILKTNRKLPNGSCTLSSTHVQAYKTSLYLRLDTVPQESNDFALDPGHRFLVEGVNLG